MYDVELVLPFVEKKLARAERNMLGEGWLKKTIHSFFLFQSIVS